MENILAFFLPVNFSYDAYWKASTILLIGSLVLSLIGRFVFGEKSILNISVSSSFCILFIYGLTVILNSSSVQLPFLTASLPFVSIDSESLLLIDFFNTRYTTLCSEILSMIILSFLVNLADSWLPKKKNIFSWLFFRLLTVVIGFLLYLLAVYLFSTYLPDGIVTYAPAVLLVILVLMLLTGTLKITIGTLISTVNPIIGGLYSFFFATLVGKQITRAVLTTGIIAGLIIAMRYTGIAAITITSVALPAYLPIIILLIVMWYLLCYIL